MVKYGLKALMEKYFNQPVSKIRAGMYDEPLEKLYNVTLFLTFLALLGTYLVMFQLGCFENYSEGMKPPSGIEWLIFPN